MTMEERFYTLCACLVDLCDLVERELETLKAEQEELQKQAKEHEDVIVALQQCLYEAGID